jgi:hypothetical protein
VGSNARQPDSPGKRGCGHLQVIEPPAKFQQQLGIETRAHLPGEYQVFVLIVSDKQRTET